MAPLRTDADEGRLFPATGGRKIRLIIEQIRDGLAQVVIAFHGRDVVGQVDPNGIRLVEKCFLDDVSDLNAVPDTYRPGPRNDRSYGTKGLASNRR